MATSVIENLMMPSAIQQDMGQSAKDRVQMLERKLTQLDLQGDIKPATILNLSPFELSLGDGLIPYHIPACPHDKRFIAHTIRTTRHYFPYVGNQEFSGGALRRKFDVNILLPIQQLMEFSRYYMGLTEDDRPTVQGGVVVFLGEDHDEDGKAFRPTDTVRVPQFMFRKQNRYIVYNERPLGECVTEAEEVMRRRCMTALAEADRNYDLGEQHRANIQNSERVWHDLALRKSWITESRPWRNASVPNALRCPRCQQQYISKTGVCKCAYVVEPLAAYLSGEITVDHVRLNTLTKTEWAKVKAEQAKREEARG